MAFLLHLKNHGKFILIADQKMNIGVHPPKNYWKFKKSENFYVYFLEMWNFLGRCTLPFIFWSTKTLFFTTKSTKFVLEQMVLVHYTKEFKMKMILLVHRLWIYVNLWKTLYNLIKEREQLMLKSGCTT